MSSLNDDQINEILRSGKIYTDSMEVARSYYEGKLMELELQINVLNVQEHPHQIVEIAKEILVLKATIKSLTKPR